MKVVIVSAVMWTRKDVVGVAEAMDLNGTGYSSNGTDNDYKGNFDDVDHLEPSDIAENLSGAQSIIPAIAEELGQDVKDFLTSEVELDTGTEESRARTEENTKDILDGFGIDGDAFYEKLGNTASASVSASADTAESSPDFADVLTQGNFAQLISADIVKNAFDFATSRAHFVANEEPEVREASLGVPPDTEAARKAEADGFCY